MSHEQTELLAEPREVDVVAIERELTGLWKEASEADPESQATPVVRACALNLIVVADSEKCIEEMEGMVGDVTAEHPARLFLIAANRNAEKPRLDAWISARCSVPVPGGKQVCCEQINLTAHGSEAKKIPSIVTSLLVSDVPGVLLWKSRVASEDPILGGLAHVLDRVVIDSSEEFPSPSTLAEWYAFIEGHRGRTIFGDLAWTHLTPWRSVIANAFNPKDMRPLLDDIRSVQILYSSTSDPKHTGLSQALLLVAWLASKLDWRKDGSLESAGDKFTCSFSGRKIRADILPTEARPGKPGGIESVSLQAGGKNLLFAATTHEHCMQFRVKESGTEKEEMLTAMNDQTEAMLVSQELEVLTRDKGYETVLRTLAALLNQ